MLAIHPLPLKVPRRVDRVVVTSGQSLDALRLALPPDLPLTAVGQRTAERAREMGFSRVDHAGGTAASIIHHLGPSPGNTSLLLATGQGLAGDLAIGLRQQGWAVTRRVVYWARSFSRIASPAREMLASGQVAAILFYSPATARAFLDALGPARPELASVRALALSPRIGDALRDAPFADISIAAKPEERLLLDLLGPVPLMPFPPSRRNRLS